MKILRRKSAEEVQDEHPAGEAVMIDEAVAVLGSRFNSRLLNSRFLNSRVLNLRFLTSRVLNPIWVRELRARWRRPLTHIIVLAYAGILSWLAWMLYSVFAAQSQVDSTTGVITGTQAAAPGYQLFIDSTWMQMLLWAFIAPLLASPAISIEYERGRLPELHLAGMTAGQIVRGKLLSTLSLVAVLLLAPLPITALCFQTGGVSPLEFCVAFVMQAAWATMCATLGLACSANSRKVVTSLGVCVLFSLAGMALITGLHAAFEAQFTLVALGVAGCSALFTWFFESIARSAVQPQEDWKNFNVPDSLPALLLPPRPSAPRQGPLEVTLPPRPVQQAIESVSHAVIPLEPPVPASSAVHAATALVPALPSTAPVQELEHEHEAPVPTLPLTPSQRMPTRRRLSWAQQWAARNPICERELRIRLRSEEAQSHITNADGWGEPMPTSVVIALCAAMSCFGAYWLPLPVFLGAVLGVLALICIVTASNTFTQEREQNMLSMLMMTFLSPREIAWGKVGVPLLVAAHYFTHTLALIVLVALLHGPLTGLSAILLIASFAFCASAIGVGFSWICRHAPIAVGGAIATLVMVVFGPLAEAFLDRASIFELWVVLVWGNLLRPEESWALLGASFALALVLFLIGALVIWGVERALRPGPIETEDQALLNTDLGQSIG